MGWYLCYFLHRHLDFRRAEVQALADLAGCGAEVRWRAPHGDVEHSPLWHVWLPSDAAAREICERSVLVKAFVELWGEGDGPDALCASIASFPAARKDPFLAPDTTFKVELEDFGWTEHGTRGDNWAPVVRRMDALAPAVTFLGKARMKDPQHVFWSVETAREGQWKGLPSDIPPRNYFGRVVAKGLGRACMKTYDLTKRRYLGPTSMDVEMGLIMCNMAHARPGGVVWDPFCGTGSILIAAAHFGAMTLGSDIDIRVIKHGKRDKKTGKQVDVWTNFEDYGLPPPVGLVRMDLHKHSFRRDPADEATTGEHTSSAAGDVGGSSSGLARGPSVARLEGSLQAVVGDPPYGVRAGGRKSGGRKRLPDGTVAPIPEEHRSDHIPSTVPYPFSECLDDLMDQSARLLEVGGRLCFFAPAAASAEDQATAGADEVPSHPSLELRASCMQLLGTRWGRRLAVFEKTKPYDEADARRAHEERQKARRERGGMEDLLERMRETVYHGERAAAKKKKQKEREAREKKREEEEEENDEEEGGASKKEGDESRANEDEKKRRAPRVGPDAVAEKHREHSRKRERMPPGKRTAFRGKLV